MPFNQFQSFPSIAVLKNPPANTGNTGDSGSIPSQEDPPEKEMAAHSSILGKFHGQRSVAGYNTWGLRVRPTEYTPYFNQHYV